MNKEKLFDMSGNKLILPFVLVVVSVLVVFFMIMVLAPVKDKEQTADVQDGKKAERIEKVDLEKVEADYKSKAAQAVKDYTAVTGKESFSAGEIENIKQQLLALKVPTKFKDLHISLVMAMVKMENFLNSGSRGDKLVSEKAVIDAKKDYAWLN